MKLRLTHNSIRIRIQRSELALLQSSGQIKETVAFPSTGPFQYEIAVYEGREIHASFKETAILIELPKEIAQPWMDTTQVGIETDLQLKDNERLSILIEKDFPCLDRPNEDKSETFWELVDKPAPSC